MLWNRITDTVPVNYTLTSRVDLLENSKDASLANFTNTFIVNLISTSAPERQCITKLNIYGWN